MPGNAPERVMTPTSKLLTTQSKGWERLLQVIRLCESQQDFKIKQLSQRLGERRGQCTFTVTQQTCFMVLLSYGHDTATTTLPGQEAQMPLSPQPSHCVRAGGVLEGWGVEDLNPIPVPSPELQGTRGEAAPSGPRAWRGKSLEWQACGRD